MNKLHVSSLEQRDSRWIATTVEKVDKEQAAKLKGAKRMLVDSDSLAFIYILEDDQSYHYLSFPKETWSSLAKWLKDSSPIDVEVCEGMNIHCESLKEELSYLIENIEGNSNYGEEMETAVREWFQS